MVNEQKLRRVTKPFGVFKRDALGVDNSDEDEVKQHFLRGAWGDGTLKSYNSGVVKLHRFAKVKKVEKSQLLPISSTLIKQFVVWASMRDVEDAKEDESVKSSTLKAYVAGIKAWHMYHDEVYPSQVDEAVRTLLRATRTVEARASEVEKKRPPVLLADLVTLMEVLPGRGETGLAMLTVALVAFWGTARLGELISDNEKKCLPRWYDLEWNKERSQVSITIYNAKTAKPGELQYILLDRQNSLVDPVSILEEWFAFRPWKLSEEIFLVLVNGKRKQATINQLRSIWNEKRPKSKQMLHGHSFRIGGALLRWNLGAGRDEVKRCGRWASNAYLVYLRKFSDKDLEKTKKLLHDLTWRSDKRAGSEITGVDSKEEGWMRR